MLQQPLQLGHAQASVRKTFFVSERRASGTLSLVECGDGMIAVQLDGRLYGGRRWTPAETEQAVDAYIQINAELKRENEKPLAGRLRGVVHPDAA